MKRNGKKLGLLGTILVIIAYILLVKAGIIQPQGAGNATDNNVAANNTPAPIVTEAPTEAPTIPATESETQSQAPAETLPNTEKTPESKSWIGMAIIGVVAMFLLLGMIIVKAGSRKGKYSRKRRKR